MNIWCVGINGLEIHTTDICHVDDEKCQLGWMRCFTLELIRWPLHPLALTSIYRQSSVAGCRQRCYQKSGDKTAWDEVKERNPEEETRGEAQRKPMMKPSKPIVSPFSFVFLSFVSIFPASINGGSKSRWLRDRTARGKKRSFGSQTEIIFKDNNYISVIKIQFQPPVILFPSKSLKMVQLIITSADPDS